MSATKITVEATIAAGKDKVWDYYTNPKHIVNWNFASDDWYCPSAENDMRVGGKYSSRMEAKDGSFGFDFEAIYDEVVDNNRIVYTIADGRKVMVGFQEKDGKTDVEVVFEAESQNPVEMQKGGWQAILDNFKKYAENN
ncbi:SRPBCC family protein [Flavobacterium suzhouense]|uniref:SRPBCC family protein n=1 Tax=Flavobacterium suzhouense TaxID=1529638 RepID=A0ABW5NSP4_9FLAO